MSHFLLNLVQRAIGDLPDSLPDFPTTHLRPARLPQFSPDRTPLPTISDLVTPSDPGTSDPNLEVSPAPSPDSASPESVAAKFPAPDLLAPLSSPTRPDRPDPPPPAPTSTPSQIQRFPASLPLSPPAPPALRLPLPSVTPQSVESPHPNLSRLDPSDSIAPPSPPPPTGQPPVPRSPVEPDRDELSVSPSAQRPTVTPKSPAAVHASEDFPQPRTNPPQPQPQPPPIALPQIAPPTTLRPAPTLPPALPDLSPSTASPVPQRVVQVQIGTVEIRAHPTPPLSSPLPPPTPTPPMPQGFDDYVLIRNYINPERY